MPDSAAQAHTPPPLPRAAVALCALSALPYAGMILADPEHISRYGVDSAHRAALLICLVIVQLAAVTVTARLPYWVLAVATAADLIILLASDRLGLGSTAIMVVIWYVERYRIPGWQLALAVSVTVFSTVLLIGEVHSGRRGAVAILILVSVHLIHRYLLAVVAAEHMLGRERLHRALRDRAELLEREKQLLKAHRRERVERELRAGRDALARDLHDIAGHHLSGVIVSAQAAAALRHKDPDRSYQMLQTVQDSARTALADLRQVVALLRSEDDGGSENEGRDRYGQDGPTSSAGGPRGRETTGRNEGTESTESAERVREPVTLPSLAVVPRLIEESRRPRRPGRAQRDEAGAALP